jgi:prepilin-type N-terminal cleavage/methylation domain-containing protein
MKNTKAGIHRRGMSIAEMLISLVIVAVLLTATASALNASLTAYSINQEQGSLQQLGRIAVHRISATLRTSVAQSPDDPGLTALFSLGQTVTGTGVALIDDNGNDIIFRHDGANRRLLAIHNGAQRVLANGVTSFSITMEPMRSPTSLKTGGGWDLLRRAVITISLQSAPQTTQAGESTGNQTVTLSTAVLPRQNVW